MCQIWCFYHKVHNLVKYWDLAAPLWHSSGKGSHPLLDICRRTEEPSPALYAPTGLPVRRPLHRAAIGWYAEAAELCSV